MPGTSLRAAGAALIVALPLTACVFPDQVAQIQKDVADIQQEVRKVAKQQTENEKALAAVQKQLSGDPVKRSEIADINLRLDDLGRKLAASADAVEQTNRRVDRLSQDVQAGREATRRLATTPPPAPTSPVPGAPGTPAPAAAAAGAAGALPSPDALYNAAYTDFSKGNFDLAIEGFQEYARQFGESDLADNAMYWVGECHYSQAAYANAVKAFDAMLEAYPSSDKAPAANLKKGLAFLEQNQISQAIVQLRYVATTFPESDEAKIARDRLAGLGKPMESGGSRP